MNWHTVAFSVILRAEQLSRIVFSTDSATDAQQLHTAELRLQIWKGGPSVVSFHSSR